ncbi:polycystin-1-like isoform X2 [Saccostrea cucullata]|uniref:polycystin-1-like isoform X2 n=1 Tax=Saccostrea cuccullata TaxID=36930 RepID=UPI002ED4588F
MVTWNRARKKLRYGQSLAPVHIMFLRFGVFLCIFGAVIQTATACTPCPSMCSCTLKSGTKDECEVECQGQGYRTLPTAADLPAASSWKIVKLDLSNNDIEKVPRNKISFLTNLQELSLRGNNISIMEDNTFDDLDELEILDLSSNHITQLPDDLFESRYNIIKLLNISHLQLTSIDEEFLRKLKEMEILDASYNKIERLSSNLFNKNKKIQILDFSYNKLTYIESSHFINTILQLDLTGNLISSVDPSVLDQLPNLQNISLAGNPWECTCSLKDFHDKLIQLETSNGLILVDKWNIRCSNLDVPMFNLTNTALWCPGSFASCYDDTEQNRMVPVIFSSSASTSDVQECIENCFDNNATYGVITSSVCLCGTELQDYGDCYCSIKAYSVGDNIQCSGTAGTITKTYANGVFEVQSGLKFDAVGTITAGQQYTFTARVTLRTITSYTWSFGDTATTQTKMVSLQYCSNSYTYLLPGTYTLTVRILSTQGGYSSGSITVEVVPPTTMISASIQAPSSINFETGAQGWNGISAIFSMAHKLEYTWSRSPDDNITSTTGGGCDSTRQEYHGRCLQLASSSYSHTAGGTHCSTDMMLSVHFPSELTYIISQYGGSVTTGVYLDAKKSGTEYYWSSGSKAYFTTSDVNNAGVGDCVYISKASSDLQGTDCNTAYNVICQSKPIACPHGGSLYSGNGHCYKLQTSDQNWATAQGACTSLGSTANLAKIDSAAIESFILNNVVSAGQQVWTGLSDQNLEGQLEWADGQIWSTYPSVTTANLDCFSLQSSGMWQARSCTVTMKSVCEYNSREVASVPTYAAGTAQLIDTPYSLTTLSPTSTPHMSDRNIISLFPGLWINREGKARAWNFRTTPGRTESLALTFMVLEPVCTTSLIPPGCNQNGAWFGSCVSSPQSCTKSASCASNEDYCLITDSCLPKTDPCSCTNRLSTYTFCNNFFVGSGTKPKYRVRGQTYVVLPAGGEEEYTVPVSEFTVYEHDVLAFATNASISVIKCDTSTGSDWEQSYNSISKRDWLAVGDSVETDTTSWVQNSACYFNLMYTANQQESVPSTLQYFTDPDSYTYTLNVPSLGGSPKTASIKAEEEVGEITWIHPPIQTSGGVNVLDNTDTYFVFSVTKGTHLVARWTKDGVDTNVVFQSSCPASIAAQYPTECSQANRPLIFSHQMYKFLKSNGASQTITVSVSNDLPLQKTKSITVNILLPLSGLNVYLETPTSNSIVEIGSPTTFITNITDGTPSSYSLRYNGSAAVATSTSSSISYTFTNKAIYQVSVTATDGLTNVTAEITVRGRYKAGITGLAFTSLGDYLASTYTYSFVATATAVAGADVTITWQQDNSTVQTTTEEIGSTAYSVSRDFTFPTAGNYTVSVSITDEFGETKNASINVEVIDPITNFYLMAQNVYLEKGNTATLQAKMDPAPTTYGAIVYTFDYGDGSAKDVNITDSTKQHTYANPGDFNATCIATNGPSTAFHFITLLVQEKISNFAVSGDQFVVENSSQTYTATVTAGTSLNYQFKIDSLGFDSGYTPNNVLTYTFTATGIYTLTISTRNDIDFKRVNMEIKVVSADTLVITSFIHSRYVEQNTAVAMNVSLLHHDITQLSVTWDYGDSITETGVAKTIATHTYTTSGDYIIMVNVTDPSISNTISNSSAISVMRKVQGLTVDNSGTGKLNSTAAAVVTITANVSDGTNLVFIWECNGVQYNTGSTNYIDLNFTTAGTYSVAVNVSNAISSQTQTTRFSVQAMIETLGITCASCVTDGVGNYFLEAGVSISFTATYTGGSDLQFVFNFDGTPSTAQTAATFAHTYTPGNRTLSVTASNEVDSQTKQIPIAAQSRISSVAFPASSVMPTIALVNETMTYTLTVTDGSDVKYIWKFCATCAEIYHETSSITNPGFDRADHYQLNGTAYNMISVKSSAIQITVVNMLTNVTIASDLIADKYAITRTAYTFYALPNVYYPPNSNSFKYYVALTGNAYPSTVTSTNQNYSHPFPAPGDYKVKVVVDNVKSNVDTEITVHVQDEVSTPAIASNMSADVATGSGVQLTVSVSSGSNVEYAWSVEENGVTQTLSSTTNTLDYLFSRKGNFTLSVNVSNIVSWKIATYHQQVMDAVENISISHDISLTTSPYVAKGQDVTFTSNVGQGDAYTVTWTIVDSTSTTITTHTGTTFVYAFTSAESYTVKMKVQNAVSSPETTLLIFVQVPLVSLVLSPTKTVAKSSESLDITAVHNTNATHLTYSWTIDGSTTSTTVNTLTHSFPSPGKYTVTITVSNRLSSLTAHVDITVQDVIQDLAITGCDTEAVEDTAVNMSTSISAGTDVTYSWEVINGATHTGSSFSTMFDTTGIYSISVNASNLVDSKLLTCTMTIIGIISDLHIDTSHSVFFVNYTTRFAVGGKNLVGVKYNWTFTGPTTINLVNLSSNLLSKKFADHGQYTGTLIVFNSISEATEVVIFEIKPLTCDAPTVVASGSAARTIYKSSPVSFELDVDMHGCMDYIIKYSWEVNSVSSASCSGTLTAFSLPSTVYATSSKITIPGKTLPYGYYCIKTTAEYDGTPLNVKNQYTVTVIESPLVALLSGGNSRTVSNLASLTLNGTESYDRDDSSTPLTYSWACSVVSGASSPTACSDVTSASTGTVTLDKTNMVVGQKYRVTLTVSSPGRTSGSTSVEIEISGNDVPLVSINCVSCSAENHHVINAGDQAMLEGSCSNCASASSVTYTWTAEYGTSTLTLDSTTTSTGNDKINLVVKASQLPAASVYKFKLQIQKVDSGTTTTGYGQIELDGNTAPSGGSCSLSPASVKSLEDIVTFTCSGYSDSGSSSTELYYRVKTYSSDGKESVVQYYGSVNSAKIFTAPWPGNARNTVQIKIFVEDEHGAKTQALDQSIGVAAPSLSATTNTEYIFSLVNTTLANMVLENNPSMILQYSIALVHEINEQSRVAASGNPNNELILRTKIRNAIGLASMGLPLETLHEKEQTAFILEHLTKYETEFQTKESQTIALNQVDTLKSSMRSIQGANDNSVLTTHLMACISNLMAAANAGVYDATSVVNSTKSLEASLITSFKANISTSDTHSASRSDEDHKKFVVNKAFENSEEIVTVNLKNQILGQDPLEEELSGIMFYGLRTKSDVPDTLYQSAGMAVQSSNETLNGIVTPGTEVLQLVMGISRNPFTWGYSTTQVNSKIMIMSFKDTSGSDIAVQSLSESRALKFYLPDGTTSGYSNIDGGGLISNPAYDPTEGLTMATYEIEKSSKRKININTAGSKAGHAMHIQLRISLINDSIADPLDEIEFYLGKGYVATSSTFEQKLILQSLHMVAGMDHTNYTMFIDSTSFDPSASYTITVYNNDPNFAYNVSAALYFTSCGYYSPTDESWSGSGCSPTSESLPMYTTCTCNHLTPFGGSMLVPPDAISFADLTDLDLSDNPVVFITCSVIFVIYVVAVIVCRRMDKIDLDRIATIPLCGKDGSFKYQITVITGRDRGSGTTAHVGIKLYGEYGKSKERQLVKDGAFQRNCVDSFFIANDTNLGNVHKIMIWHDNFGLDPSWHMKQVIIRDMQTEKKYYFFGNCWMTLEREQGFIQKEIRAAGASEIKKFSRMFRYAVSNSMADRHLWVSILDRPANSRFNRVQRATVCITLLYVFMGINAMWYGILKTTNTSDSSQGISSFGWEEVVLAFLCNIMVFPFSLLLIFVFKKSRSKTSGFDPRPQTAKTIEIDNDLGGSQYSSSFRSESQSDLLSCMERESTTDSTMLPHQPTQPLRKTKTLKTRKGGEETAVKVPLPDSAEGGFPEKSRVKEAAEDILNYLDGVEQDAMARETKRALQGGGAKPLTRKHTMPQKKHDDLDDLLMDEEMVKPKQKSSIQRRVSSVSIGSGRPPHSSGSQKSFNPRQDPNIRKTPSASSNKVSKWVSKLHTTSTGVSLPEVEHIGPLEPDMGLAQRTTTDFYTDGYSEMTMEAPATSKKPCSLPAWCIYVGYVLCFLLSGTSCILVILYGRQFGADIALQWLLALLFCFIFSFLFVEPVKALFIALYLAAWEKKTEDTDDVIDNEPKFDMSNELVKEVKFSPLSGFALLKAKEDGMKIQRLRLMLRQFVAYMFYLLLVMALCYTNFSHHTYTMSQAVEESFIRTNIPNSNKAFQNISSVEELWTWTQSVLISGLHYDELTSYTEFNTLLGVARLRQVRGLREPCPVKDYPLHSGLDSLAGATECEGSLGYTEDKYNYGYLWNITQSQNLSWRYHTDSQTESKRRQGYVFSYGGGGYVQYLGSTFNESLTALQDLQTKDWIDLRTRAVFIDFTMYNPAEDLTTFTTLIVEFPLTGGMNTSFDIQTNKLLRYIDDVVEPVMVCEVILFLVVTYYLIHIVIQIREQGRDYFLDAWNWLEMLTTLMAVVSIGLYIGCLATATDTFSTFLGNPRVFTNFEKVSDIHTAARYLHAWLLFLLMFKVVKQIRFIKVLHKYEKTLSSAFPKLVGVLVIFSVLYLAHGMIAYLFLGNHMDGFENYWTTLMTLLGMIRGRFNFFPMLEMDTIFTHCFFYSYYIFTYGLTIALIIAVLNDSYKTVKSQMYYKSTLDLQDYEMIDFMMKRFKLWAGFEKPKEKTRRVHFAGQRSVSDRCSTSHSNRSYGEVEDTPLPVPVKSSMSAAGLLSAKWEDLLKTMRRVEFLDEKEDDMIAKTQKEVDEWGFQSRLKNYESERQGLLQWKETPPVERGRPVTKVPHRTMTQKSLPGKSDLQPSSSASGPSKPTAPKGRRPLSDGGRIATDNTSEAKPLGSRERKSIYNFFKSIKPSRSAWNN